MSAPLPSGGQTAPLSLLVGQTISAVVVALLNDTTLRLQTPSGLLDLTTAASLPPGTPVALNVQGTSAQPEITITPVQNSGQPTARDMEGATNAASPQPDIGTAPEDTARSATAAASSQPETSQPARATSPVMQAALTAASVIFREAVASQGGLATLYANLETLVAEATPGTPRPVLTAAKQLLALKLDTASTDTIDAGVIKTALLRAGLAAQTAETSGTIEAGPGDMGAALIGLRQVLKNWLDLEAGAKAASPLQNAAASPAPRAAIPMPPYRGAPTVPQAPEAPSITTALPREQASQLLAQTNAAIARQTLLRIASLPEQQTSAAAHSETSSARLMFDIPIATAQGTGVAQMTIERDRGNRRGGQNADPVWRTDFSVDMEPIGAVHVHIALAGTRATVTMKAERPQTAAVLSAGLPLLEAGLRGAALEPGELRCHEGAPRSSAVMPGAFLDQAT